MSEVECCCCCFLSSLSVYIYNTLDIQHPEFRFCFFYSAVCRSRWNTLECGGMTTSSFIPNLSLFLCCLFVSPLFSALFLLNYTYQHHYIEQSTAAERGDVMQYVCFFPIV